MSIQHLSVMPTTVLRRCLAGDRTADRMLGTADRMLGVTTGPFRGPGPVTTISLHRPAPVA